MVGKVVPGSTTEDDEGVGVFNVPPRGSFDEALPGQWTYGCNVELRFDFKSEIIVSCGYGAVTNLTMGLRPHTDQRSKKLFPTDP